MAPLKWTREKPTAEGWYWYRWADASAFEGVSTSEIGYVDRNDSGSTQFHEADGPCLVSSLKGWWSGPIPTPEDS